MSAEVAPTPIDAAEARQRLARVRDNVEAARSDLIALYVGRAWLTLGHDSWDALCDAELGGVRIALPRDDRRDAVAEMRQAGMSTRAIGSALGVGNATVARDLATVPNETVDEILSLDGRTRPAHVTTTTRTTEATKVEQDVDVVTGEIVDRIPHPSIPKTAADREREDRTQANTSLARSISRLSCLADPMARALATRQWDPALCAVYPADVNPSTFREIATGLLALADEWEHADVARAV